MLRNLENAPSSLAERVRAGTEVAAGLFVGVAVVIVPIALPRTFAAPRTPYALDIKYVVSSGCALLAGLALLIRWAAGGRLLPKTAGMARVLGLFLCAVGVSLAFCRYREAGLRETWLYAAHAILFLAAAVAFRKRERAARLVGAILLVAALVAIHGSFQASGVDLLGISWSKGGSPITLGPGTRVLGTIGLETALGGYMAMCSVLAVGGLFFFRNAAFRVALGLAALLMAACMVFTGSRAAWFGFAAGLLVLLAGPHLRKLRPALRSRRGKMVFGIVTSVIIVWAALFGPGMWERVRLIPGHLSTRTTIWRTALRMFYDSPVVGKGPGAFRIYFADFRPRDYASHAVSSLTLRAHSEYLEVLSEAGMLGMLAFVLFLGLLFIGSARALSGTSGREDRPLLLAAVAATVAILVHATAGVITRYPTCQMMLWVLMGLVVARWGDDERAAEPKRLSRAELAWRILVVLGAVGGAGVIWTTQVWRPYLARVHLARADASQEASAWGQSIASARRALGLDPASVPSHYTLGNSLFYAGRHEAALAAFRRLQLYSPNYCDVHLRIAVLNALLGRMDGARAALRLARRYGVAWGEFATTGPLTDEKLAKLAKEFEQDKRK